MNQSPEPSYPRPPYEAELGAMLAALSEGAPPTITADMIPLMRSANVTLPLADLIGDRDIEHEERTVPGPDGDPDITLSIFTRRGHVAGSPGIFHTHGGGMINGNRFGGIEVLLDWVVSMDAVLVSVEYRLAPEHPDPAPVDDCYAGLVWTAAHADELGFDASRLLIAGASAGGGLAAGVTLMARDLGGPDLAGSLLIYPMLDDRNETVSSHQYVGIGVWDRGSNDTGWNALLGDRRFRDDVSIYAVPSRADDLGNLPPTFIEVGSAEVFRDEDVAYATAIWAAGGVCELHVWPGAFHGSDLFAVGAVQNTIRIQTRTAWARRVLGA
jgi:acetyl esterase/lipase